QATDAGRYPPIINASGVLAAAGWNVELLHYPVAGHPLKFPQNRGINILSVAERASHAMSRLEYLRYITAAARRAIRFRPDVVYASDAMGAAPGLLAARLANGALIYHAP